jgi:hypothetical protein
MIVCKCKKEYEIHHFISSNFIDTKSEVYFNGNKLIERRGVIPNKDDYKKCLKIINCTCSVYSYSVHYFSINICEKSNSFFIKSIEVLKNNVVNYTTGYLREFEI